VSAAGDQRALARFRSHRPREPRPRGLAIVVLAILVAMLCGYVAILLERSYVGQRQREQLACQVQRLGGEPVGGVDCPPKPGQPTTSSSPRPAGTAAPASPSTIVVRPSAGGAVLVQPASPAARPRASRPPSRPAVRSSPTARATSSATPSSPPVVRVCLPPVPCLPR
jgi:hypothetical protein